MVNLKDLKKVKSFDIEEFNGCKTIIEKVELSKIEEKDFGQGLQKVQQIIIQTANLSEGKEVVGTEYVNLSWNQELNEFVIPDSPKSKAIKILNYFKVDTFDQLEGKECLVIKKVRDSGKEYLGISIGA